MATAVPIALAAPAGATLYAGKFATGLFGSVDLADVVANGALSSNAADLAGSILLDEMLPTGGASVVQSALALAATAVSPGSVAEFASTTLNVNDATGTRPWGPCLAPGSLTPLDWANDMAWSPTRRQAFSSGGRPYNQAASQKVIRYDETTDSWRSWVDPFSGGSGGHIYDSTALADEHGVLFHVPYGNGQVHLWDIDTQTYIGSIAIPPYPPQHGSYSTVSALEWAPNLGPQGSLLFLNSTAVQIKRYDWATGLWSEVQTTPGPGLQSTHTIAVRLPVSDIVLMGVAYTGDPLPPLLVVDGSSGAVSQTPPCPAPISCNGGLYRGPICSHPNGTSAILFSKDNQRIYEYVAATNTWSDRAALPTELNSVTNIACTIPDLGIVLFVDRPGGVYKTYIYKPGF